MTKIKEPPRTKDYPDRFLDCQEALAPGFEVLFESAVAAGWKEDEVIAALIELADNRWLANGENIHLQRVLASLKRHP